MVVSWGKFSINLQHWKPKILVLPVIDGSVICMQNVKIKKQYYLILAIVLMVGCTPKRYVIDSYNEGVSVSSSFLSNKGACIPSIQLRFDDYFADGLMNSHYYSGKVDGSIMVNIKNVLIGVVNKLNSEKSLCKTKELIFDLEKAEHFNGARPESGFGIVYARLDVTGDVICDQDKKFRSIVLSGKSGRVEIGFFHSTNGINRGLHKATSIATSNLLSQLISICR